MLDPAKLSMNGINNSLQSELTDDDKSIGKFFHLFTVARRPVKIFD